MRVSAAGQAGYGISLDIPQGCPNIDAQTARSRPTQSQFVFAVVEGC